MSLTVRSFLGAVAGGLALVLAATALTAPTPKKLQGTVGPGFTISLTLGGKTVTKLKKGVPYRLVVRDRASIHDFHLVGPGIDRVLTSVGFTGTKSLTLKLKKGVYRYYCDPHAAVMNGSFRVA